MTAHTPGPWRFVHDAQGPCMVMHPTLHGVAIANLSDSFHPSNGFVDIKTPGAPERSANARLIAAAPELLAALKYADWFMEHMAKWMQPEMMPPEQYNKIKWGIEAAIAKAKGETP